VSIEHRIGIFKTVDGTRGCYECEVAEMVQRVAEATHAALGNAPGEDEVCKFEPSLEGGVEVHRVAEIVVRDVDDPVLYRTERDEAVGKPTTDRAPDAEAGSWVAQSLIFDKAKFDMDGAKAWIKEQDGFGDYGSDETEKSYRFRQYDPEYFDSFKTGSITDGVSAVYGKVKQAEAEGDGDGEEKADEMVKAIEAVRDINAGIMAKGVRVLAKTAQVRKDEEGGEERFVLGLVLEPNDGADGAPLKPDTQDDVYSKEDVRQTAHGWMEHYGHVDLLHSWQALGKEDVRVLESFLAPVAFKMGEGDEAYDVVEGTWFLGLRVVNDDLWKAVKDNELGAFSIGGTAERVPVEGE